MRFLILAMVAALAACGGAVSYRGPVTLCGAETQRRATVEDLGATLTVRGLTCPVVADSAGEVAPATCAGGARLLSGRVELDGVALGLVAVVHGDGWTCDLTARLHAE